MNMKILFSVVIGAVLLGACTVRPSPISISDRSLQALADRALMFAGQEEIDGPITLYEGMARGIKYNLDHRLKIMEQATAIAGLNLTQFDMLPRVVAQAGYTERSNVLAAFSRSVLTGRETLEPSTSQDRGRWAGNIVYTWNILDFGVSYFQARQSADRVLIAGERRRKVVQNLIMDIRFAFWRAAAAQLLGDRVQEALNQAQVALDDSRSIEAESLQPIITSLRFQQSLLEIIRQLETLRDELLQAKTELASLLNIRPGTDFELEIPDDISVPQDLRQITIDKLEDLALAFRPELYEADYTERINAQEARKAIVRMLPGLELNSGGYFDANSFAFNNTWAELGTLFTWNLMDLASGPTAIQYGKAQQQVSELQRLALSMAIISQVRLSHQQYTSLTQQYKRAREIKEVNQRIAEYTVARVESRSESGLAEIRTQAAAIFAELMEYQTYAMLQNALGRMYASLGLDPLPDVISDDSIATVAASIEGRFMAWEKGDISQLLSDAMSVQLQ